MILFAITATRIQTQGLPDQNQNVKNDALNCLAMKADCQNKCMYCLIFDDAHGSVNWTINFL